MTFRQAFLITYAILLGLFACILLMHCVLPGRLPRHSEAAVAIGVFGLPLCSMVIAWLEARRGRREDA